MPTNLKGRSFLTLKDFTTEEIQYMLDLSAALKEKKRAGIRGDTLAGKSIALIFEKPSTRTRCAFTVACVDEGGHPNSSERTTSSWGTRNPSRTPPRCWGGCSTGYNSAVSNSPSWKTWPFTQECPSGTASPTSIIPPRSLPIS